MSETEWAGEPGKRSGTRRGWTTDILENQDPDLRILCCMKKGLSKGVTSLKSSLCPLCRGQMGDIKVQAGTREGETVLPARTEGREG